MFCNFIGFCDVSKSLAARNVASAGDGVLEFSQKDSLGETWDAFVKVSDNFVPRPVPYRVTIFDSWLQWLLASTAVPALSDTQDVELLSRRGWGLCHQVASILAARLKQMGYEARLYHLQGHVIAEVLLPQVGWRAVDPMLGIFWKVSGNEFGRGISREQIKKVLVEHGLASMDAEQLSLDYATFENNAPGNFPWSDLLLKVEHKLNLLKWIIPSVMLLSALALWRLAGLRN